MPDIRTAASILNRTLEEANIQGDITVTIPHDQWSHFEYKARSELEGFALHPVERNNKMNSIRFGRIEFVKAPHPFFGDREPKPVAFRPAR